MRVFAVLGLTLVFAISASADKIEADALDGTWRLTAGEANGKALSEADLKDGKLVLKGSDYTVAVAGRDTTMGKMKLNATKEPKTIDIVDGSGPNKDKTCEGIYELKGDEFRVAFAPPGKPRPKKFASEPDSGQWVHVWKRVKD